MKASLVPEKCNQLRCAAQHTTAGAVSERNPATQPRRKQNSSSVMTMALDRERAVISSN
jgi:hypothetical protein